MSSRKDEPGRSGSENYVSIPDAIIDPDGNMVEDPDSGSRFGSDVDEFGFDSVFDEKPKRQQVRGFERADLSVRSRTVASSREQDVQQRERMIQELRKRYQELKEEPAALGLRGRINAIFRSTLPPGEREAQRRIEAFYAKMDRILITQITRAAEEVMQSNLDINVVSDFWNAPVISVGSSKGGVGKTTTITAICQFMAKVLYIAFMRGGGVRFLRDADGHFRPVIMAELNPDKGTLRDRMPGSQDSRTALNTKNTYSMYQEIKRSPEESVLRYTWPTRWDYLKIIPQPSDPKERRMVSREAVESIYDSLGPECSLFFIDNGTSSDSQTIRGSLRISNAFLLIVDPEMADPYEYCKDNLAEWTRNSEKSMATIAQRLTVAIVSRSDKRHVRASAKELRQKLWDEQGISAIIVPYDHGLDGHHPFDVFQLSVEYRSAIADISTKLLEDLNQKDS